MKTKTQHTATCKNNPNELECICTRHTPTPWSVGLGSGLVAPNGKYIVTIPGKNAKEDAAFIVRAVNSHEALLEAIERVKIVRNSVAFVAVEAKGKLGYALDAVVEELNTAIAQAEGGK